MAHYKFRCRSLQWEDMMIEQDLEQIMLMKQQHVESFVESDDYDLDEADEAELIELLKLETFNDDIDVDPGDL